MHIRNRNELISWLENNAPFRAIARAIQEGQVENLGAFEAVSIRGWVIKVTSKFNKIWYIKITPLPKLNFYGTVLINAVPWEFWIGETYQDNKLYCGDNPKRYKELRENAMENNNKS